LSATWQPRAVIAHTSDSRNEIKITATGTVANIEALRAHVDGNAGTGGGVVDTLINSEISDGVKPPRDGYVPAVVAGFERDVASPDTLTRADRVQMAANSGSAHAPAHPLENRLAIAC
jgi:hypothetical protein